MLDGKKRRDFINSKNWVAGKYNWQEGYGFFSHSHSALDKVTRYALNQKEHHKEKTFRDEYLEMLNRCDVIYKEEYLFDWILDGNEG
ncbi:MAG: hypothetical protein ABMA02_11770 [Saprospiraceae bacterium]